MLSNIILLCLCLDIPRGESCALCLLLLNAEALKFQTVLRWPLLDVTHLLPW